MNYRAAKQRGIKPSAAFGGLNLTRKTEFPYLFL